MRFAVRDLGLDELETLLVGPTAIAFVDGDAVGVAKALRDFARTNPNLVVKGGVLGTKVLTAADAGALADLPSREVLLARLAGGLAAPLQQFAGLLQALPRNFAYGLKALIDQQGGVPEAPRRGRAAARARGGRRAAADAEPEPPQACRARGRRTGARAESPPTDRARARRRDRARTNPRRSSDRWPPRKRSSTPSRA